MLPRRRPVDRLPLHDRDGRRRNRLERQDVTDGAGVDGPRGDAAVVGGSWILRDHNAAAALRPSARRRSRRSRCRWDHGDRAIGERPRGGLEQRGSPTRRGPDLGPVHVFEAPTWPTVRCRSGRAVDDAGLDEFPLRGRLHSHFRRRRDVAEDAPPRRTGMLHDHGWRPACPQGVRQAGFAAQTLHQPTPRRPPTRDDRLSTS